MPTVISRSSSNNNGTVCRSIGRVAVKQPARKIAEPLHSSFGRPTKGFGAILGNRVSQYHRLILRNTECRAGKRAAIKVAQTETLIFNARLNAVVCSVFIVFVTLILLDSFRVWFGILSGSRSSKLNETPFVPSSLTPEQA